MTEVINSISDFEKYIKNTKKVVEEALDFYLGPENPEILSCLLYTSDAADE